MSRTIASELLLFGFAVFIIGGLLAMKVTIREDAKTAPSTPHPSHMTFRRSLPRHGVCRLGVALMVVGVLCMLASYFARM